MVLVGEWLDSEDRWNLDSIEVQALSLALDEGWFVDNGDPLNLDSSAAVAASWSWALDNEDLLIPDSTLELAWL